MDLPHRLSNDFNAIEMFKAFIRGNPQAYPFWDTQLTKLWESFLHDMERINDWILGSLTIETNKLITFNEMINNTHQNEPSYNIYISSEYDNFLILNKKFLNHEQLDLVYKEIPKLVQEFIYSHTELINYIREKYRDIKW